MVCSVELFVAISGKVVGQLNASIIFLGRITGNVKCASSTKSLYAGSPPAPMLSSCKYILLLFVRRIRREITDYGQGKEKGARIFLKFLV